MSEGRTVFLFCLGLVALIVVLQLGVLASDDREAAPGPRASATPTASNEPRKEGCPSALKLPDGASAQVCRSVEPGDLTALKSVDAPGTGRPAIGFRSPSGSIGCADIRGETVACAVKGWAFDAPDASVGETVVLSAGRPLPASDVRVAAAAVDDPGEFAVPGLQFGQVARMNDGWFCGVEEVGVACWSPEAGSGLLVSRTQWTTWSPEGIESSS